MQSRKAGHQQHLTCELVVCQVDGLQAEHQAYAGWDDPTNLRSSTRAGQLETLLHTAGFFSAMLLIWLSGRFW